MANYVENLNEEQKAQYKEIFDEIYASKDYQSFLEAVNNSKGVAADYAKDNSKADALAEARKKEEALSDKLFKVFETNGQKNNIQGFVQQGKGDKYMPMPVVKAFYRELYAKGTFESAYNDEAQAFNSFHNLTKEGSKEKEEITEEKQAGEQPKSRDELIAEFEKENPELVEFLDATKSNSAYVVLNGKVAVTGVKADEFKKWKEEKAAEKKEEPKQEESKQEEKPEKTLGVDDSGNGNSGDENSDEWEKRYYEQHKAVATASNVKTGEPTYTNPGVSFEINGNNLSYASPTKLNLDGETNFEALRAVVGNAQKEGISEIDFSKINNPKNIERFFILAVAYGMKIDGLEKMPELSQEELTKLSVAERKSFDKNFNKVKEKTGQEKNPEPKQEEVTSESEAIESKDYAHWREEVKKAVEEKGKDAKIDFAKVDNEEDKTRLFLAAKVFGAETVNVDPKDLDVMAHVGELPKIDQMRLMVINKQETGVYKEKDSDFDKGRDERAETKVDHKEKIGKTTLGTDERKEAVAKRNVALEALKNRSR